MEYVGSRLPTLDAALKVTGEAIYTDDIKLNNMLYEKVLLSSVAHGKVKSINTEKAKNLEGVRAVITFDDVCKNYYNRIWISIDDTLPAQELILTNIARRIGDKIAAVAADSYEIAEKAVKLIEVVYEELPVVLDQEEALKEDSFKIYKTGNLVHDTLFEAGDIKKAKSESDYVFENTVTTKSVHHGTIEPHVCIGNWDRLGELQVYGPQQGVHRGQMMLARIFDVRHSKIHYHGVTIGGSFGGKDGILFEAIALLLSKQAGKPVKIKLNRKEAIISRYTRHAAKLYTKIGVSKDGTFNFMDMKAHLNAGAYCGSTINVQNAMGAKLAKMYKTPNIRFIGQAGYTNALVAGAMRGYGTTKTFLALELLIDKIAKKLHIDPVDLRLKNLIDPYDMDLFSKKSLGNARAKDCIKKGSELFDWQDRKKWKEKNECEQFAYGYGMAMAVHGNGVSPFAPDICVVSVSLNEDGTFSIKTGVNDQGGGTYTVDFLRNYKIANILREISQEVSLIS